MYCETTWKISDLNASSAVETSLYFDNCKFHFDAQTDSRGVPAQLLGGSAANTVLILFTGGAIFNIPSVAALAYGEHSVAMLGTSIQPRSARPNDYEKFAHNATLGGLCIAGLPAAPAGLPPRGPYSIWIRA